MGNCKSTRMIISFRPYRSLRTAVQHFESGDFIVRNRSDLAEQHLRKFGFISALTSDVGPNHHFCIYNQILVESKTLYLLHYSNLINQLNQMHQLVFTIQYLQSNNPRL
ncbi:Hypothetical_protein [Hexamita inflata]|uniref:Hypothetical_protein n=1 Tax=Hexamita inflata TaxID=28002 RepID=A0AA86TVB5_9EUKA|nr:Hypothetical protein HINF_LOCUS17684 [Hexamita inflata]